MRRLVVLGTGTGVGKTWVTTALCRSLAHRDPLEPVLAVKLIETGYDRARPPLDSDAAALAAACHLCQPPEPHPYYAFPAPVSPFRAAGLAGKTLYLSDIVQYFESARAALAAARADGGWSVAETAGGVFSPLTSTETNFELAALLAPAGLWALVAPDALGVIHDVTATLEAMRARGRTPDLVILNRARPADASTGGNADELRALGVTVPIAHTDDLASVAPLADTVARLATARRDAT
ncbi:MAG: dethiobiotin synthase [Sorangiineae bacterium]|nr:dethiobiotin synthase [Polyangiaceae bacterium]MEB2322912.1 dethiobiotin synthase [Sorangiineae bacterium]